MGPTTITTLQQAYWCLLDHYYSGPVLDDRVLLTAAFAGLTQELVRQDEDRPDATMPALTGDRAGDLAVFSGVYRRVTGELPRDAALRQAAAAATMRAMVGSLNDNHATSQSYARVGRYAASSSTFVATAAAHLSR